MIPPTFLFVLVLFGCILPSLAVAKAAEIVAVTGQGEYKPLSQAMWREAKVSQILDDNDLVRTGRMSGMGLLFADQTQIRLDENTTLQVRTPTTIGTTLNLAKGRSWMQSKNPPVGLKVETLSANASIQGTDWVLEVNDAGETTLTVLSGEVAFYNDQGSVTVRPQEQALARPGQAPVKRALANPRERVQWVTAYHIDVARYPELSHPTDPEVSRFSLLLQEGRLADLMEAITPLAGRGLAVAELLRVEMLILRGEYAEAQRRLDEGAARHPEDVRFPVLSARLALLKGEGREARIALDRARVMAPQNPEVLLVAGDLARFEGQATPALSAYQSATALAPTDARGWQGAGIVEAERENLTRARPLLDQAVALTPEAPGLAGDWANLATQSLDFSNARQGFKTALENHPDDYVALTGLGFLELRTGHPEAAREALLKASLIEPKYARAHLWLGVAHYQLGQTAAAQFELGRASELDPKDPLPHQMASLIHGDQSNPGEALEEARQALVRLPFLKSLTPLATNQQGTANLGSALANYGLEDWSLSYARQSYDPLWAGSHFFLAERLLGSYSQNSELLQGYLTDPTAIGASNRFQTLVPRPGHYASAALRTNRSDEISTWTPSFEANGYSLATGFPVAYFVEGLDSMIRPGDSDIDVHASTYTVALGLTPRHDWGLFLFATGTRPEITEHPATTEKNRSVEQGDRLEAGLFYRPRAREAFWLKAGVNDIEIRKKTYDQTDGAWKLLESSQPTPHGHDVQFSHTLGLGNDDIGEWRWGFERAYAHRPLELIHFDEFIQTDRARDDDTSTALYGSLTLRPAERLKLQFDLDWLDYAKHRQDQMFLTQPGDAVLQMRDDHDDFHTRKLQPRLGLAWQAGPGQVLRLAWQKWRRSAANTTLAPLDTAGVGLDDQAVLPGGLLERLRGQVEWEWGGRSFISAFLDYKDIHNLTSDTWEVYNSGQDIASLERLRSRDVLRNLSNPEQLEDAPIFSQGRVITGGLSLSHLLTDRLAGYLNYLHTHSENTSDDFHGFPLPYMPTHRVGLGLTWTGANRLSLGGHAVYRSERFTDEKHLSTSPLLPAGPSYTFKAGWHTRDQRGWLDLYGTQLGAKDTSAILGVNLEWRF
ncbi:conserved hypothetical protein [Gammaproteobacteria bacterium]